MRGWQMTTPALASPAVPAGIGTSPGCLPSARAEVIGKTLIRPLFVEGLEGDHERRAAHRLFMTLCRVETDPDHCPAEGLER